MRSNFMSKINVNWAVGCDLGTVSNGSNSVINIFPKILTKKLRCDEFFYFQHALQQKNLSLMIIYIDVIKLCYLDSKQSGIFYFLG